MNKKTRQKSEQCESLCSVLPICILVSILTAVLVTLIFSISFVRSFKLETKTKLNVSGAFKDALSKQEKDSDGIIMVGGEAVVDFFGSGQTGFIYAAEKSCNGCSDFGVLLANTANDVDVSDVYHYEYDEEKSNKAETTAKNITIGREESPVFVYVRDGVVFDRLDDPKSEADLSTFLAKYR